jgi:hypothetical protein
MNWTLNISEMKKSILFIGLSLATLTVSAQVVNSTKFYVSEGAVVSFGGKVTNTGEMTNKGQVYLKSDLENNGQLNSSGEVIFNGENIQRVSGLKEATLAKVSIENNINLQTSLNVTESVDFKKGYVTTENAALQLDEKATHTGASDFSHVAGVMRKTGNGSFDFPVGDGSSIRNFEVKNINNGTLEAQYVGRNPLDVSNELDYNVEEINQTEYWVLKSTDKNAVEVNLSNQEEVAYLKGGVWVKDNNKLSTLNGVNFTSGKGKVLIPEIGIWPNPSYGEFNLKLTGMRDSDKIMVDITNQDGRVVMRMNGTVKELRKAYTLPQGLVTTTLTVRVVNGDTAMSQNLILHK